MDSLLSLPLLKALATDATDTAFASKVVTATEPTGNGVVSLSNNGQSTPECLYLHPYSVGDDDATFSMRVIGWEKVGNNPETVAWKPRVLAELACTLCTAVGVAGRIITATERFCDTITIVDGNEDGLVGIASPGANLPAAVTVLCTGFQKVELTFDSTSASTAAGMNCLYRFGTPPTSLFPPSGGSEVSITGAALTALQLMDDWDNGASDGASVSGDVAHDTADAGEPVKIGGKALTAQPTAVTANDRVNAMFDVYGRQIALAALREMKGNQKTTITSSTSETTIVTADATYKLDIYCLLIANSSATDTEVTIKDSTAGTTRVVIAVKAGATSGFALPMDAGHNQNAANNNWTATCADAVASIEITAMFVKNL